jgi:hypothetical protein
MADKTPSFMDVDLHRVVAGSREKEIESGLPPYSCEDLDGQLVVVLRGQVVEKSRA